MNRAIQRLTLLAVGLAMVFAGAAGAQQDDLDKPPSEDEVFWFDKERAKAASAAQIVGIGLDPISATILRTGGWHYVVWDEVGFTEKLAPKLSFDLLVGIRDRRRLPEDRLDKTPREDVALAAAFSKALVNAFWTPVDAFKNSSQENRFVTFADLMDRPTRFRGKVVPIQQGRMVQLREIDPTLAAKSQGVKTLYNAWVFGPTRNSGPYCVQFPILPEGLEPAEKMNVPVSFYGYFLTVFEYEGEKHDDGRPRILHAPLLVGPTVIPEKKVAAPVESQTPMAIWVLGAAISFLLFLSVVFFAIYFLSRRSDQKILTSLDEIKDRRVSSLFKDEPEGDSSLPPSKIEPPARAAEGRPIDPERN